MSGKGSSVALRRSLIVVTAGALMGSGLIATTMVAASAHQGNIKPISAKCVDADTMVATYEVSWANVPGEARNTVIGSRTGTTTFNDKWDDSPAAASAWANVNRGAVGSEAGTRSWTVTIEKAQFAGSNGPWEYAHFPWTNGTTSSRYHDTRVESFDWNKCVSTSVKDASASISITPATCDSPEKLVLGPTNNATWGTPTRTTGPGPFSVPAIGNAGPPQHLFQPGPGVSADGKTQTFTGELKGPDTSQNCWARDAAASVTVHPGTCDSPGSAEVTGLQYATLVGTLDQSVGSHVAPFQSVPQHLFPNGSDALQVPYTIPGKDTSVSCNPPAVYHPRAKVRAYCVTKHWGEGVAALMNKQSTQAVRYHIVRSGQDRIVTVRAGKNVRVELRHLRVGSVVKIKVGQLVLDRAKVKGGCSSPPDSHTGQRTGTERAAAG